MSAASRRATWLAKAKAERLCYDCGQPHERINRHTGHATCRCDGCAKKRSRGSNAYQTRRQVKGLCVRCGQPHEHISQKTKKRARMCFGCTRTTVLIRNGRIGASAPTGVSGELKTRLKHAGPGLSSDRRAS